VALSNVFRAAGSAMPMLGEVLHRHQAIVGFLGQLQHSSNSDLSSRILRLYYLGTQGTRFASQRPKYPSNGNSKQVNGLADYDDFGRIFFGTKHFWLDN